MSATRRGYVVAAICVLAFVVAFRFGARALNAVVVPGVVALFVGWLGVRRRSPPTIERESVRPGFPGENRTVTLDIDADRTAIATVYDAVADGLSATDGPTHTATIPGRVSYDCMLEARGEHVLGPTRLTVTDAFGLFERAFRVSTTTADVLVYPEVRPLSGRARRVLGDRAGRVALAERGEFDSLREYVPGDRLRDVHWKASAKREDLVVAEYEAEPEPETDGFALVVEATPGQVDDVASVAASVLWWLLETGIEVDLSTPNAHHAGLRTRSRETALTVLARMGPGRVATARRNNADVLIDADGSGATITIDGRSIPATDLLDDASVRSMAPTTPSTEQEQSSADSPTRPTAADGGRLDEGIDRSGANR